ncbi:MAG: helix-turn-helix transcriptional regulator [Anaerolineaceae bacterium]|nr:helix-turn-helix transcriptional regulator [Anaerolineaceae bacterium]
MSKLQDVRKSKSISQGTLAELTEMSLSAVTKLEQGQRNINKAELSTLLKLCLALNCRLSDILDDPENLDLLRKYEA